MYCTNRQHTPPIESQRKRGVQRNDGVHSTGRLRREEVQEVLKCELARERRLCGGVCADNIIKIPTAIKGEIKCIKSPYVERREGETRQRRVLTTETQHQTMTKAMRPTSSVKSTITKKGAWKRQQNTEIGWSSLRWRRGFVSWQYNESRQKKWGIVDNHVDTEERRWHLHQNENRQTNEWLMTPDRHHRQEIAIGRHTSALT